MKKTWMWCLIGVLLLGSAARSPAQTTGGTEKTVAALEEQWLQAQKTNNADLLAPLLADKFVSTGSDGKVTGRIEDDEMEHCRLRRLESHRFWRYGHSDGRLQE